MSEVKAEYRTQSLLNVDINHATLDDKPLESDSDWAQMERMLIPLLNYIRKAQGKRPVIVPKG